MSKCFRDAVRGDAGAAEGGGEEIRVVRLGGEAIGQGREVHTHLDRVLNGLKHLIFERVGPFIPKEMAALIPAGIAEAH